MVVKKTVSVKIAHSFRKNKKHAQRVLLVGSGKSIHEYKKQLTDNPHYGYEVMGCVSEKPIKGFKWFGEYGDLATVLKEQNPDEVVIAVSIREEPKIQGFIDVCDQAGVRAAIIPPIYRYFKSKCQVDMVGTLPVINTRYITAILLSCMSGISSKGIWNGNAALHFLQFFHPGGDAPPPTPPIGKSLRSDKHAGAP